MTKIGRNALCPCGSGLKYKRCCEEKDVAAEIQEAFGTFSAEEQAEMLLHERMYQSILGTVWLTFHGDTAHPPKIGEMEQFYQDVYGCEFDLSLIDEIVFPLSPTALTRLIALHGLTDEKIVDITPTGTPPPELTDTEPSDPKT